MRDCGILLPISALPGAYGIGTFGKEAYDFVDCLVKAGQSAWQILPLGPTGFGDSPYQAFSTFAGNPYFIDPATLMEEGWLAEKDLAACDFGKSKTKIDYGKLYVERFPLLKKAAENFVKNAAAEDRAAFRKFSEDNADWLPDYALYMAIKSDRGGASWDVWPEELRLRKEEALAAERTRLEREIFFYSFLQFEFDKQWKALKEYANEAGIRIIGDLPIYVSFDSADAWGSPELFQFDEDHRPIGVAGCPPDAFSETGQLWGNPLYNWKYHADTGYKWWLARLKKAFEWYDTLRIDHFRGFDEYWFIPAGDETAAGGHWEKGPGDWLFDTVKFVLGKDVDIIAEDLGVMTPTVEALVERTGYPGMKVLQFAFDGLSDSAYQPHNHIRNCIVYTGTHDNDTTLSWYRTASKEVKEYAKKYLGIEGCSEEEFVWAFIRTAYMSVAEHTVIPMQDVLVLGNEARMNFPSTTGTNWQWRMTEKQMTKKLAAKLCDMSKLYVRYIEKPEKAEEEAVKAE